MELLLNEIALAEMENLVETKYDINTNFLLVEVKDLKTHLIKLSYEDYGKYLLLLDMYKARQKYINIWRKLI